MAENKITLKQVLNKIKNMDDTHKFEWVYSLLKEFGSEVTSKVYHEGYEQGKFDEIIKYSTLNVEIPDYVGYWLEYCKATNVGMVNSLYVWNVTLHNYARMSDADKLRTYFLSHENQEKFLTAWVNGYSIIKEKFYFVAIPCGNYSYRHVFVNDSNNLVVSNYLFKSEEEIKKLARAYKVSLTEKMIKESPLAWAWQFAKELEDY